MNRASVPAAHLMTDAQVETTLSIKNWSLTSFKEASKAFEKGISASNYVRLRIAMTVHQAAMQLGRHSSVEETSTLANQWDDLKGEWSVERPFSERDNAVYLTLHKKPINLNEFYG